MAVTVDSNYLIISLGCSFGVLLMLLITIIIAAVPIAKKKGKLHVQTCFTSKSLINLSGIMLRKPIVNFHNQFTYRFMSKKYIYSCLRVRMDLIIH